jgi:aldose sugar dehydrogenase
MNLLGQWNSRQMIRDRRVQIALVSCIALFVIGVGCGRLSKGGFKQYFGVSFSTFVRSPLAYWRVYRGNWDSSKALQFTQEPGGAYPRRNVETALLPLNIEGVRLSESYPVPKVGGAITVIGTTVIILDRLGGLYRYDLTTRSFGLLPGIPKLPNNLDTYLARRPGPPVNLGEAVYDEFRARDIIFLSDRKELAVAYDKFDEALGKIRTVVSIIPFDASTLTATGSWQEVFVSDAFAADGSDGTRQARSQAGGGRLAYRGDGRIYLTIGDHLIVDPPVSEDPNSTDGKTIEINLTTNKWHVFSKGHRNQEGLTFLRSGQLVATEHGERGGDELNVITEGGDYGWPNVTLGTEYNSYDWPAGTSSVGSHAGYTAPLFAWVPSIAPTQLIEVHDFNSRWDGDLLIATLKAASLYRLRMEGGRVLYSEPIWIGDRIRDIEQSNGTIILWTDDTKLLFITVNQDQLAVKERAPNVIGNALTDSVCLGCHHFGPTSPTDLAPSLSNLLKRPIASDAFSYSSALRAKGKLGPWTPALLSEFLSDTFKFASGTIMPAFALGREEIDGIVDTLVRASDPDTGTVQSHSK